MFFSTDAVSLYPSLPLEPCSRTIARLVRESTLVVEGVHWDEAVLYLALTIPRDKVEEMGLGDVVPRWRKAGGRGSAPGMTTKEHRCPLLL